LYVSKYALYDIIEMRACVCDCALYDIIKLKDGMCLNMLHMIIFKWELVCFWMPFVWYY